LRKRAPSLVTLNAVIAAAVAALVVAAPAQAGSLHLVFPQSVEVTVVQGESTNFTLDLQALGATACSDTTGPAQIDTVYSVNSAGQVASGMPAPVPIQTDANRGSSDNCYVKTPVEVPLTATVAPDTPVGDYTSVIHYGNRTGPTDLIGPTLTIHVIAPDSAEIVTAPELVPPVIVVLGERQAARPTLGKTVMLTGVKGNVTYREPGQRVKTLSGSTIVHNGTAVDALDGVVKVTVVRDSSGELDSVDTWGGRFTVNQSLPKGAPPLTTLTLVSSDISSARKVAQAARAVKHPRLWANGKGNFKTRGKRASAIVRGTYWLTEETSAGTKVSVKRGLVAVQDLVAKRTVLVSAGHSYLARNKVRRARRIPVFTGSVR
jgi:hypothetical protein